MKVFTFTFFLYLLSSFAFSQRMEQEMDSLLNVLQKQQPDSAKVRTYLSLAQINSISNIENSLKWAESGLNLATQLQYKKGIVACSNELGYGYSITGNNEKALTYLTNALNIAENQGLWLEIIDIHNSLGMIFGKKEEYEKAVTHFKAALKSAQEHNLSRETAIGYNNVGLLLSKQGQYVLALDHFLAAEQLYEKAKLKKNYPLNNIASLYLKQGNYETATEYVEKALKIGKIENDKKGLGESYDILGQVEQKKGNYQSALSHFRNAYQIKSAFDNQTDLIASYNYLGNVYELLGNFKEALVNYGQTIALCEKLGTRNGLAFAYLHGSTIAYSQSNFALAESQVKKSIEIAKRDIGEHQLEKGLFTLADIDAENLKNGYYVISNIYAQKGNYTMAAHAFILAKNLSDSLSNSEIARTLANMRTKFEIDNKNAEIEDLTFEQNQQNALLTLKKRQRNISLIGACLLLIATTILVYTVIEKGRKNILLEQKYTEFELLQFKIEKQNVELTQQNITKDKLFSIISHDIRTPINGLKSMLTLLNASQIPTFLLSDLSEKLQKNIDNVSTTIDNLLNWSVSQMNGIETHPQNVRVGDVAVEIEKMYQANAAAKKISLENIIEPDIFIYADPDHLRLLLRNLVGNALKFTPLGGKIILSSVVFSNGQLAISITDTGVGMSAEKLSKLFRVETHFTEYGTAKEKGAGLGLLLCKEFVEKNKGSIWVTSEEGKGSTFSFSLPLVTSSQFAQLA